MKSFFLLVFEAARVVDIFLKCRDSDIDGTTMAAEYKAGLFEGGQVVLSAREAVRINKPVCLMGFTAEEAIQPGLPNTPFPGNICSAPPTCSLDSKIFRLQDRNLGDHYMTEKMWGVRNSVPSLPRFN